MTTRLVGVITIALAIGLLVSCNPSGLQYLTTVATEAPDPAIIFRQTAYPGLVFDDSTAAYPAPATMEVIQATENAVYQMTLLAQPSSTPYPTPCPLQSAPEDYSGCQHPPLPAELVSGRAWLLADYETSDYVYSFTTVAAGNIRMLWLERSLGSRINAQAQRPEPYWKIQAVMPLVDLPANETYVNNCGYHGIDQADPEIFAIAITQPDADGNLDIIQKAWRANRQTAQFETISTDDLVCYISPMEYWR